MAGHNYEVFDDGAFYWFGMTFLSFLLFMPTYRRIRSLFTVEDIVTPGIKKKKPVLPFDDKCLPVTCHCDACHSRRRKLAASASKDRRAKMYSGRNFLFVAGWIVMLFALSRVGEYQSKEVLSFDPYEILGVEKGAELPAIKKAYRKMSLMYHPDRTPGDQEAANKFILIAKAYGTLTDDAARENWEKYGSPDGYQGTSTVIGLPSFLVKEENKTAVLIGYLFLVIVAPVALGIFYWKRMEKVTEGGIQTSTIQRYFESVRDTNNPKQLMEVMCLGGEFEAVGREAATPKVYNVVAALNEEVKSYMARPVYPQVPFVMASNILIHAHLLRQEFPKPGRKALEMVLRAAFTVTQTMIEVSCHPARAYRHTPFAVVRLMQALTQAIWPGESALLQLPHIGDSELHYFQIKNKKKIFSVSQFLEMTDEERRKVLRNHTDRQLAEMIAVARLIPDVNVSCRIENKFADDDEMPAFDDDSAELNIGKNKTRSRRANSEDDDNKDRAPVNVPTDRATGEDGTLDIYEGDLLALYVTLERKTQGDAADVASANAAAAAAAAALANSTGGGGASTKKSRRGNAAPIFKEDKDAGAVTVVQDEGELGAHKVSKEHKDKEKVVQGSFFSGKKEDVRDPVAAHAPRLPFVKQECWHLFLTNSSGQIVGELVRVASPKDSEEVLVHFQAPPKGKHELTLHVMCDSYVGVDHMVNLKVNVAKSKDQYTREAEAKMAKEEAERISMRKVKIKARRRGSDSDASVSSVDTEEALDYSTDEDDFGLDAVDADEETDESKTWLAETLGGAGAAIVIGVTAINYIYSKGMLDPLLTKIGYEQYATDFNTNAGAGSGAGSGEGSGSGAGFGAGSGSGSAN